MDPTLIIKLIATATTGADAGGLAEKLVESGQGDILTYLTQSGMFVTAGAIYLIPQILRRVPFIGNVMNNQWVVRIMPLYPIVASIAAMYIPGAVTLPNQQVGTVMVGSVWMAFLAMMGHKLIGQTVLGDDHRITTLAVRSPGQKE